MEYRVYVSSTNLLNSPHVRCTNVSVQVNGYFNVHASNQPKKFMDQLRLRVFTAPQNRISA